MTNATPETPETTPAPVVDAPRHAAPTVPEAPDPTPEATTARTVLDVIGACDGFTALEWLDVVRYLDMPSHVIQGDVALASLAVAVVEDARDNGFWRWDKFGATSATDLLTGLGVDLQTAQEAIKRPHPHNAPKSGDE